MSFPETFCSGTCPDPPLALGIHHSASVVCPSSRELALAADYLNRAQKVTILGGAGCEGAHTQLMALAAKLKAPVVHAMRGKEFIEYDNPYDVGMTGLLGFSSGYHAMMNCDALLMLGTDFPYPQFFPSDAKIIQVDLRGEQIGRRTPVDLGLIGKVEDTLDELVPLLADKLDRAFLDTCLEHYKKARKGLDDLAVGEPGQYPHSSPIRHQGLGRVGLRGCGLHLRCRYAYHLGCPLSAHERTAPPSGFVHAWLDGQCAAPGHRCPGCLPGTAGHQPLRRWRSGHAAG